MRSLWLSLICAVALSGVAGACSGGGGGDDDGSGGTGGVGGTGGTGGEGGTGGTGGEGGTGGTGGEGGTGGTGGEGGTGGTGGEGGTGGTGGEGGTGGTGGEGGTGPEIIACPGSPLPPLPSGTCSVAPGSDVTVLVGDVLAPDRVFQGGQVLVDASGVIRCVACDCSTTPGFAGATTVTCPNAAISPGFLNPHDHITYVNAHPYVGTDERYEHRHDWRQGKRGHTKIGNVGGGASQAAVQYGELRFVMGGATSVNGSGSAPGFLRNLDRSGDVQEGLGQKPVNYETFPLDDSDGRMLESGCGYNFKDTEDSIAGDDSYTPHVSEGIDDAARNEFLCLGSTENGGHDLIQPKTAIIHGIGLKAADIAQLAAEGTSLIWSPRSNLALYGETARVTEYARQGVRIALGTDWIASGSMNVLRELQCADYLNQEFFDFYFSDADLWRMVTLGAAEALAVDDAVGSLAVDKVADIAVFAGIPGAFHRAVIDADADDVVLVLRGGQVLYGDANLVPALPGGDNCDDVDVCGTNKQACVLRETGMTLAQLQGANQGAYPLFFCGQPDDEPSCHPSRPGINVPPNYTGVAVPNDGDGDGIPDISDNCPGVFNPIRPIDDGIQGDHDLDFVGDACDPCPLAPNTDVCPAPDPNDRDADGVPNASDNCPTDFNPEQDDRDGDGKGDLCDECPEEANPGEAACPATIAAVKQGAVPERSSVAVRGALVTGVHDRGFFVQTDPEDAGYAGPAFSGVYVFTYNVGNLAVGDRVDIVRATVANFYGQIQLNDPEFTVTATDQPLPAPVAVAPADVVTNGPLATAYEGVLVRVANVTVTDLNPPVGGGDHAPTNEFAIDGGLRVNDLLYLVDPFPVLGERFASITGVLEFRNDHMKIEPRSGADFVAGALSLLDLEPASSWARVGEPEGPTFPEPLTASVARAAYVDTGIALVSSDPTVASVPATVTLPARETAVAIPVTAMAAGTATITASLGGVDLPAEVVVLAADALPTAIAVSPATATVTAGSTTAFTVSLDLPAPAGGLEVDIVVTGNGNAPGTVTIPGNGISADFDFVAGGEGTARITVTAGTLSAEADVTVAAAPQGSLVINEVDYDQPSIDTTEFVEIWNGTGAAIDLAGYDLVFVNGNGNREYDRIALQGVLPADGYLVLGTSLVTPAAGALFVALPAASDNVQNGEPDGLALVRGNTVIDAISYEGSITAATLTGFAGPVNLVEGNATNAADRGDGSLCRVSDTGDDATDWAFCTTVTPGAANQP